MQFRVLASVELFDANPLQQVDFDQHMHLEGWSKVDFADDAPSTYFTTFDAECDEDVNRVAETDIAHAAEQAGVDLWDGICMMSEEEILAGCVA